MRKTGMFTLAVALTLVLGLRPALADSPKTAKPVVVVSFAGYNELLGDLKFAGDLVGHTDLDKGVDAMLTLFTRGQGLAGIDKGRPWGAAIFSTGDKPTGYGFVPVTDLKKSLALLDKMGQKSKDVGGGITEIDTGRKGRRLFIRESKGWAFISDKRENLAKVAPDPGKLIDGLPEKYDWAVRLNVCNVPAEHREKLIDGLKKNARRQIERIKGSKQEMIVRRLIAARVIEAVDDATKEIEHITIGAALDHDAKNAYFELAVTALKGTAAAKQFAELGKAKTDFAGFRLSDATVQCGFAAQCTAVNPEEVAAVFKAIRSAAMVGINAEIKSEEKADEAKKFVGGILKVVGKTIASGRLDGGMSLVLKPDGVTLVAGRYCADGKQLEKTLGLLVKAARKEHPEIVKKVLKANVEEYKGVRLHLISVPLPKKIKDRDKIVRLVGEKPEVVVGFGKEGVYFAAGKDALKTLKSAIKQSQAKQGQAVPPLQFSVSLRRVADFAAEVGEERDKEIAKKVAEILAASDGKDHINIVATPIERGVKYRLEFEEGVLKLAAEARNKLRPEARRPRPETRKPRKKK